MKYFCGLGLLALLLTATPVSVHKSGVTVDQANAIVGRPATPRSVAGVHRRAHRYARRAVRRCVRWSGGACVAWGYY